MREDNFEEDNFEEDNFEEDNFEEEELYEEYLYFEYKDKWESSKKQLKEQADEIKRLNNIIAELEKWLEEQHQFIIEIPAFTKEISIEHKTMEICYEDFLNKLQELKGSDKE